MNSCSSSQSELGTLYTMVSNLQAQIEFHRAQIDCHGSQIDGHKHELTKIWQHLADITNRINSEGELSRQAWIQNMQIIKESFKDVVTDSIAANARITEANVRLVIFISIDIWGMFISNLCCLCLEKIEIEKGL